MKSIYFAMNESKNDVAYTIESSFNIRSNNKIGYILFVYFIFLWLHHCIHVKSFHSFPNRIFSISTVQISFFFLWRTRNLFLPQNVYHSIINNKRSALFRFSRRFMNRNYLADARRCECLKFYGIQGSIDYNLATTFS